MSVRAVHTLLVYLGKTKKDIQYVYSSYSSLELQLRQSWAGCPVNIIPRRILETGSTDGLCRQ